MNQNVCGILWTTPLRSIPCRVQVESHLLSKYLTCSCCLAKPTLYLVKDSTGDGGMTSHSINCPSQTGFGHFRKAVSSALGVWNSFCELRTTFIACNHLQVFQKRDIQRMGALEKTQAFRTKWPYVGLIKNDTNSPT